MQRYAVTGMSCAACSAAVEKAVNAVEGVQTCSVSLLTNSMGVEGSADSRAVIEAVRKAGYDASLKGAAPANADEDLPGDTETPQIRRRLIASLGFLVVLMYFSMGHTMWGFQLPAFFEGNPIACALVQMLLAACVMILNRKFFLSGTKSLLHRSPNMDTLVAMGSAASFLWSVVVLFRMTGNPDAAATLSHDLYFESAAMILALITVGKLLEAKSKGKTTNALASLIRLKPAFATVEREGEAIKIPAKELLVGDVFTVRAGEQIPADGVVLEGEGAVNESALTGESMPVDKTAGSPVYAATLNASGFLKCKARKVGEDTVLSEIIQTVADAAATKAPIAKIADKVAAVFVPSVIALAGITMAVWLFAGKDFSFTLARAVSVLVISCPCALGLATPVAVTVGNGLAAKHSILFKTAESLEQTGKIQIALIDKTGTLTVGTPAVTDIIPANGADNEVLLRLALSLEQKSEHPLARAVCRKAQECGVTAEAVDDFKTFPGNGVSGLYRGEHALAGNLAFLQSQTVQDSALEQAGEALAAEGKTPLYFAAGGKLYGVLAVLDTPKSDAKQAIAALHNMGITTVMLTGDNATTAHAVGKGLGFDKVIAGVLPAEKAAIVQTCKKAGITAMIGDGINDAPALTQADVGIALGSGTDVAIDAADVVLMKPDLADVPAAIRLGRKTLRTIKQNLFWAFFYNAVCIPVAAGVLIPRFGIMLTPMMGAAAMSLSSFFVVMNALRINLFQLHCSAHDRRKAAVTIPNMQTDKTEGENKMILKVEGMMCPHCEARVKAAVEALNGVEKAVPSHEKGEVEVFGAVNEAAVKKAITDAGYQVK